MNTNISVYQMFFMICLSLSVLCFVIAGYFFLTRNIPQVMGYLTGRNEKKMIRKLEQTLKYPVSHGNNKFKIVKEISFIPTEELMEEGGQW